MRLLLALTTVCVALTACSGDSTGGSAPSSGAPTTGRTRESPLPSTPAGVTVTRVDGEPVGVADVGGEPWAVLVDAGRVRTGGGAPVAVGDTPLRLVETPDGVWVSVFGEGSVVRIDSATGEVDLRVALPGAGAQPEGLAYADGTVWVVDQAHDEAVPVDARTGRVRAPVRVGKEPRLATAGPSGVWVSAFEGGSVTRVAPGPVRRVRLDDCLGAQGIAESVGLIWVACTQQGGVQAVDPDTGQVVAELDDAVSPDAVVAHGSSVFVVSQSGPTVWTVDGHDQFMGRPVVLGDGHPVPANVGAAIVGDALVVAEPGSRSLLTVPLDLLVSTR